MSDWVPSRFVVESPPFDDPNAGTSRVVYSTRTGEVVLVPDGLWRAIRAGNSVPSGVVENLKLKGFLVDADIDELEQVLDENERAIAEDDTLYLVVQASPNCSMGCGYCGQAHTPGALANEVADSIVTEIDRKLRSSGGRYRRLQVGWFGGEPLMGLRRIRQLTAELLRVADAHGVAYEAKIPTNGVALTEAVGRILTDELRITRIEVTLDGLGEVHDRRRPLKGGSPSFEVVYRNLRAFALRDDHSAQLVVRCNVDRDNAHHVDELINQLVADGLQSRVLFYTAPVHAWGNDADENGLSTEEVVDWDIHWLDRLLSAGFRLEVLPRRRKIVCMSVRTDAEVVDHAGVTYSCTEVPYVPAYGSPNRHKTGSIFDDSRREDRPFASMNQWIRDSRFECASCRILPVCGGACPKLWTEGNVPCPPVKFSLEDRLLLHAVYLAGG